MAEDQKYVLNELWQSRLKMMWQWQRSFALRGSGTLHNTETTCSISIDVPKARSERRSIPTSTPQYQGQSYVGTADNVAGWDFTPVVAELT